MTWMNTARRWARLRAKIDEAAVTMDALEPMIQGAEAAEREQAAEAKAAEA